MFYKSLYNRMSFVHYLGVFLLVVNALVFTQNIISIVVQLVVAVVIVIHEFDEYTNGRVLSRKFTDYLKDIDNVNHAFDISTNFSSEYEEIRNIIQERNNKFKKREEEDRELTKNALDTIEKVKKGWYSDRITGNTSNEILESFKNNVNEMIDATNDHFIDMNKILEQYVNYDYTQELKLDNIKSGGVFETLSNNINNVRNSITELLLKSKQSGLNLSENSQLLLSNVQTLDQSSSSAANALDETTSALDDITSTISSNTKNVLHMSSFAHEVTKSAEKGQKLASQTTTSMDEINNEVTAISDAISVIDQIAFQTNILSLNAAVEAATAGEAGKGFAVVAQEVRNLASRSADAANEIKKLVEQATLKANSGKEIASSMIEGYISLNENITKTTELIKSVEIASKDQQNGIEQINNAVMQLDKQVQQNAKIAGDTKEIAIQTEKISSSILNDVDQKEFEGKNNVKVEKKASVSKTHSRKNLDLSGISKEIPSSKPIIKKTVKSNILNVVKEEEKDNSEWESF